MVNQNQETFQVQELQLIYKSTVKPSDRPKITSANEAYKVLLQTWDLGLMGFVEQSKILLLNRANRVLGCYEVSSGSMHQTLADPKMIFAAALKGKASAIMLAHNHPSGSLTPSREDIALTHKLVMGGRLLDIEVIDHLIITSEGFVSFAEEGII